MHDTAARTAVPHAHPRVARAAAVHTADRNQLLELLPRGEYTSLEPRLTPVPLHGKDVLVEPDVPIRDVWFVSHGAASVLAARLGGGPVEVGVIGPEGFVGLPVLLGPGAMPFRVIVQVAGDGWRLPADEFRALVEERPVVRRLLMRYAQYFTEQVSQTAACNRLHTVEERCARWLLMTHDRVHEEDFAVTHAFLAMMLGVRRAGVTVAMGAMQARGLLHYSRGHVELLDRVGLGAASCACYAATRAAFTRIFS